MAPSWYWRNGSAYDVGWRVNTPYTFCRTSEFFSPTLHGRTIAGPEVGVIAGNTHPYEGRTPAHPTVGPPLNHLGVTPPAIDHSPGLLRAHALAHPPGSVLPFQTPVPRQTYAQPRGTINGNPPVVMAPRYNGVMPQPYRGPIYRPSYAQPQWNTQGRFNAPPQFSGGSRFNGGPSYNAPRSYGNYGGGGYGGGGMYHAPSSSYSSSHSYTHSHGGGGGHGHR
jgi:hypothetical protein